MKSISLFSGIGGFDLALQRAGFECDTVCEIDKQAQTVLTRHFPEAKLYDDVRQIGVATHERKSIDLICGGFPCQDVSIAGKRAGLAGKRSGLWFEFARVIEELAPQWVIVENVPGLLSSNEGRDFAVIIQRLVECGYGVAWRVLDAQYFGVPQRRRRVFIVGSLGDGRAAQVLFERESSGGDFETGKEARQDIAQAINTGVGNRNNATDSTFAISGMGEYKQQLGTLRAQGGDYGGGSEMLVSTTAFSIQDDGRDVSENLSPTIRVGTNNGGKPVIGISNFQGVRRLMPIECERLQGFPDGWTDGQSDSARYRQLGNAVAVPVVEWIARRISGFMI